MATNTMDNDVDPSASGQSKDESKETDPTTEIASLRDRLMRALAETENTRRRGERRAEDAQQYAIANFARDLLQVVDNLRRAIEAGPADPEAKKADGLLRPRSSSPDRVLTLRRLMPG